MFGHVPTTMVVDGPEVKVIGPVPTLALFPKPIHYRLPVLGHGTPPAIPSPSEMFHAIASPLTG
jgi:hypothetical protein